MTYKRFLWLLGSLTSGLGLLVIAIWAKQWKVALGCLFIIWGQAMHETVLKKYGDWE